MKKLILPLILLPFLVHAAEVQEIGMSDTAIKNKFLSVVRDVEVEKRLGASAEFNDCRKDNVFKAGEGVPEKEAKLEKAKDCFKKKLSGKSEAELKKLSDTLGLESYGLIKSNNVNEVTNYLQKKMTIALTGKDPDEKDPKKLLEQMKWKNQKIVDQKVFIDLYKNQLMKNALFEVSRYCFENLRVKSKPTVQDFATHWTLADMTATTGADGKPIYAASGPTISKFTDTGEPSFFNLPTNTDTSDKEAVYKGIVGGLATNGKIDPGLYEAYFSFCSTALPLMCEEYKLNATSFSTSKDIIGAKDITPGATSCLVLDRLRNIRKAMADTDKVAKQFDKMEDSTLAIQMLENPTFYERGNNKGEESLDELTSMSSADMLVNSEKNKDLAKLADDCKFGKDQTKCADYLIEDDGLDKSIHNLEAEMTLKRAAEMERIKALKGKEKELKEYLTENGMFELLGKLESKEITEDELAVEIGKIYDARKVAMIEGLKLKVGKRQISEKNTLDDATKDALRSGNVTESREEKARLAQVVMFNNIITSQLSLTDKDGTKLGRNVTAWNKELKGMTSASGMKDSDALFQGLQDNAKGAKKIDSATLGDGGIIDTILGKK